MKILVLNCGSSSIKYQLLEMENANSSRLLAKGLLERIGLEMGVEKKLLFMVTCLYKDVTLATVD